MRLSINLEPDLYALAKSVAYSEDCSLSATLNRLVRRGLERPAASESAGNRNGLPVSRGAIPITADIVREIVSEGQ